MKKLGACFLFLSIFATKIDCTEIQPEQSPDIEALATRKVSASTILLGLANACTQMAKVAGAKTSKEKQESACNTVASVIQLAGEVTKEHEDSKRDKREKKAESDKKENAAQTQESQDKKSDNDDTSETKAITMEYSLLQQVENLTSEQEKAALIDKILQNKKNTKLLLDEISMAIKEILIDALFEA